MLEPVLGAAPIASALTVGRTGMPAHAADGASALMVIDLAAIRVNWQRVMATAGVPAAAVVKADGYGLGAVPVARTLAAAGCGRFFVATLDEGVALRAGLSEPEICVLSGQPASNAATFLAHRLTPVLNCPGDVASWRRAAPGVPAILHIDTGMNRLGLSMAELEALGEDPAAMAGPWTAVISHLACADEHSHPLTDRQRARFATVRALFPGVPSSLAASSGSFLGPGFTRDFVRPGAALYGVNPQPGEPNPMQAVVTLHAPILQVRDVAPGETVGYGATAMVARPTRSATVGLGYADGFPRSGSNRAVLFIGGRPAPLIGRVSMDLITLDVTDLPEALVHPGALVEILGPSRTVDQAGAECGTIGYEILTGLSRRARRVYRLDDHAQDQVDV